MLLGLAVIVLLSPGLIGLLAERSLNEQLELAAVNDPDFDVRTVAFERGWFTSAGTHRVPVRDPRLAQLLLFVTPGSGGSAAGAPPVLIVTTQLDHGLVPLGGAGRDPAALLPALASGVSTLELELADGRVLPVPGQLASRINLNGSAVLDYSLPAGTEQDAGFRAAWEGAHLTVRSSADGRTLGFAGTFDDWRVESAGQSVAVDAASAEAAAEVTPHGFAVGSTTIRVTGLAMSDGFGWQSLELDADSSLAGERVAADFALELRGLALPAGRFDADLALSLGGLTPATLGPLLRGLKRSAVAAGGSMPVAPYADFEFDLRRLLSGGATLSLERLTLTTPDGEMRAALAVELPEADGLAAWSGLALAADGRAEVTVPRALAEGPPFAEPLRPLIAGGFLVLDGDAYRLRADYARGVATVNGAPLTVPLTGN